MKKAIVICLMTMSAIFPLRNINNEVIAAEPININEIREPYEKIIEETETLETVQQIMECESEIVVVEEKYRYIKECPLSEELQQEIFDICEENCISFEFVMAVIAQESSFRPNVLGDNEKSKGLMQIQERYHSDTMKELGVTDLFDPIGNVEVGVNILRGYFEELEDVYHVLMRYNGGEPYATNMINAGKVSDYAKEITERAMRYEEENGL